MILIPAITLPALSAMFVTLIFTAVSYSIAFTKPPWA